MTVLLAGPIYMAASADRVRDLRTPMMIPRRRREAARPGTSALPSDRGSKAVVVSWQGRSDRPIMPMDDHSPLSRAMATREQLAGRVEFVYAVAARAMLPQTEPPFSWHRVPVRHSIGLCTEHRPLPSS